MPQSLANILIHLVFSSKNRQPFIHQEIEKDLHSYMVAICRAQDSEVLKMGGTEDHVHLLINFPRTITISKLLEELKKSSSKWIKTRGSLFLPFAWQKGYGAFSVSASVKDAVVKYIANQRDHHQKFSFKDEYRQILKKHGITFDERYVWD